jgi:hypothetical protein
MSAFLLSRGAQEDGGRRLPYRRIARFTEDGCVQA